MKRLCDAGVAVLAVLCLWGTPSAGFAADTFVPYGPGEADALPRVLDDCRRLLNIEPERADDQL